MLVENRLWQALKAILWNLDIFVLYVNLLEGNDITTALRCIVAVVLIRGIYFH